MYLADFRRRYMLNILRDVAGNGSCKMLRRMMGVVSVWDISTIQDPAKRAVGERLAIRVGQRWLLERENINTVDDLIGIVQTEMTGLQP